MISPSCITLCTHTKETQNIGSNDNDNNTSNISCVQWLSNRNVIVKLTQHARSKPVEISSGIVCIVRFKLGSEKSF